MIILPVTPPRVDRWFQVGIDKEGWLTRIGIIFSGSEERWKGSYVYLFPELKQCKPLVRGLTLMKDSPKQKLQREKRKSYGDFTLQKGRGVAKTRLCKRSRLAI